MQKSRENQRAKTKFKKKEQEKQACGLLRETVSDSQENTLPMRTELNLSERMAALGWLARLMLYLPG